MATETDSNCPICQDTCKDLASTLPCHHQFCLGCILRWTQRNPVCPLCRRTIVTVQFSDRGEDNYPETSITVSEELPDGSSQAGRAPDSLGEESSHPLVSHPSSPQDTAFQATGSVLPEVWADLFRLRQHLLDPMRTWLHRRMKMVYGNRWWLAESAQSCILYCLCTCGPDKEIMMQSLQSLLEEHTVPLVQDTIDFIVSQRSEGAQRLLSSHTAREENHSPAASSSSSSSRFLSSSSWVGAPTNSLAVSGEEEEAGTTEAALREGHSCSPAVPVPMEWDWPQEEPGQEVVVADPSAQRSSHSPCTPCQSRNSSPGGFQRPQNKRDPGRQDSPQPCKRPSWQHH